MEKVDFETVGSLSVGPVELPGSGCKMPRVLPLPLERTYQNGSESDICERGELLQMLTFIIKGLVTHLPPEWDTWYDVTSGLVA